MSNFHARFSKILSYSLKLLVLSLVSAMPGFVDLWQIPGIPFWPFKTRMRHASFRTLQQENVPANWARELLIIPSEGEKSLPVHSKKQLESFGICFFSMTS